MLTISLDRLSDLLNKAAEVDLAEAVLTEEEEDASVAEEDVSETLDDTMADDPTYQEFVEAVESLTQDEIYELLALGFLARNELGSEDWPAMLLQARTVPTEETLDELMRMLLLTDEVEAALDRLGYEFEEEDGDEGDEDEEGDEDDEDGEDEEKGESGRRG